MFANLAVPESWSSKKFPRRFLRQDLVLVRIHTIRADPYDTYMRNGVYAISRPAIHTRLWAFESGKMFPESPSRKQTRILKPQTERIANEDRRLDSTYYSWNKGIGRAAANKLAQLGIHVLVVGRNTERGRITVGEVRSAGGEADFISSDLRDVSQF